MTRSFYNPAAAGVTDGLNVKAFTRLEMIGVHVAPKSFFIIADLPPVLTAVFLSTNNCWPKGEQLSSFRLTVVDR